MDWFVLLTPLVVLPIVLLLAFVGCGIDAHGSGVTRRVSLEHAGLPGSVNSIDAVVFEILRPNGSKDTVDGPAFFPAQTPMIQVEFVAGEDDKVSGDCRCTVHVTIPLDTAQKGALHIESTVPHPPTAGMLKWELRYVGWPGQTVLNESNFSLNPKTS